jgi:hypothetical protein
MAKQGRVLQHPVPNAEFAGRIRTSGALTMIGGALLTAGAILIDLGWFVDQSAIASLGTRSRPSPAWACSSCPSGCAPAALVAQEYSLTWARHS